MCLKLDIFSNLVTDSFSTWCTLIYELVECTLLCTMMYILELRFVLLLYNYR